MYSVDFRSMYLQAMMPLIDATIIQAMLVVVTTHHGGV
jgi:hypothetical protein